MSGLFVCPLCGGALERQGGSYLCPNGHCHDVAKEGYTYLLPVNRRHSKAPGDDKAMTAARHAFLEKGYYAPLREKLCQLAVELTGDAPAVLDNGCGEGYYTAGIYQALCVAGKAPRMAGIDISKPILRLAARREKSIDFAVASSYLLPVADSSIDLLVNCFSPLAIEEFRRVLRPGGRLVIIELTAPARFPMKQGFWLYSHVLMPTVGRIISHDKKAYSYLPATMEAFPQGEVMAETLRRVGYRDVAFRRFTFGLSTLYTACK